MEVCIMDRNYQKKPNNKYTISIYFTTFLMSICFIGLSFLGGRTSENIISIRAMLAIIYILALLILICTLIRGLYKDFNQLFKKGRARMELYDGKSFFRDIDDCFKKEKDKPNERYRLCIYYINKVYRGSRIEGLIKEQNFFELYNRKDFLNKHISHTPFISTNFRATVGIIISFILSFILSMKSDLPFANLGMIFFFCAVILIILIYLYIFPLSFWGERGHADCFLHEARLYEIEMINRSLKRMYHNIRFSAEEDHKMSALRTQCIAATLLSREKDSVKTVSNVLNLKLLEGVDLSDCISKEIEIQFIPNALNKKESLFRNITFLLSKELWEREIENRENMLTPNKFKELLVSPAYKELFSILLDCRKHDIEKGINDINNKQNKICKVCKKEICNDNHHEAN